MEHEPVKKDYLLPGSIMLAALMISGSIIYLVGSENEPRAPQKGDVPDGEVAGIELTERDVVLGDLKAPVTIIEYGDYQCPFCGSFFAQSEGLLRENYIKTGKAKMAYRNFAFLGPESFDAAEAAECARDQSQFWAYHDLIFREELIDGKEHNGNLNRELFLQFATDLKLDTEKFAACYDADTHEALIQDDAVRARQVGVGSTPTIYINDQLIQGALPYPQIEGVVKTQLNEG